MSKRGKICQDHKGRTFLSLKELCQAYGLSTTTFRKRLAAGLTLQYALLLLPRKQAGRGNTWKKMMGEMMGVKGNEANRV